MKTVQFNFNYPIKDNALLSPINCDGGTFLQLKVDSSKDNLLEIPVNTCNEGKWKLTLNWGI